MSNPRQSFALLHDHVLQQKGHVYNLHQLVGEYALGMVQLIRGHCQDNTREMMDGWAAVDRAKRDWAKLITTGAPPHSEFCQVASSMLSSYSDALREHVLGGDGGVSNITEATDNARRFHAGCAALPLDIRQTQWNQHTKLFVRLLNVARSHGVDSNSFHTCASDCLVSAQLLGRTLDYDIFQS